jgi:endonuclease G, mitochondrial
MPATAKAADLEDRLNQELLTRFGDRTGAPQSETPVRLAVGFAVPAKREAIIIADEFRRPALIVRNSTYEEPESQTWKSILTPSRSRMEKAIRSVARVELVNHPTYPWVGTAWMISEDIAVTNRHVALEFARKQGASYKFVAGVGRQPVGAHLDFREEYGLATALEVEVEKVLFIAEMTDSAPDMALLRVRRIQTLPDPIELSGQKLTVGQNVAVIGYPANDPRNPAPAVGRIFGNIFEVKRFAPGQISGAAQGFTFNHDCSTLGGNSGSVVVDIETGKAVGLHFGGSFRQANFAVTAAELTRQLKKQKVTISVPSDIGPKTRPAKIHVQKVAARTLAGREGFSEKFLGSKFAVPLPALKASIASNVAPVQGTTDNVLRYTHFSIVMNAERRFAFFTAVNIDGATSRAIRRSRDVWSLDGRIELGQQVGAELYENNDLDRGHLVRRLDPVWGEPSVANTANDDTFFFTNCTPQHAQFNQKTWNDLEDYLLDNAGAHDLKVCVFTGPVFDVTDPEYRGLQLPQQFWKVVAMVKDDPKALSVTAYIQSQKDLLTNLEFVFGQFRTYQTPVSHIEKLTDLDFGKLRNFDPLNRQESFAIRELTSLDQIVF